MLYNNFFKEISSTKQLTFTVVMGIGDRWRWVKNEDRRTQPDTKESSAQQPTHAQKTNLFYEQNRRSALRLGDC